MKILLIEDKPSLLVAMRLYLEGEHYNVSTATNFRIASMKVHDYDCVVMDITLPDGNGLAIVKELKEAHSSAVLSSNWLKTRCVGTGFRLISEAGLSTDTTSKLL